MAQDAQPNERAGLQNDQDHEIPAVTPMMSQYLELKAANPGLLLFYRLGDFYELFFEDAEIASRALGLTLTKRGKHLGHDVPMCGVPLRSADQYLQRLIRLGHRVAICEQAEAPAEARGRGAKALIRREIVRLVTPGTLTEETLLEPARPNYLLALARDNASDGFALAWVDISTGEFFMGATAAAHLLSELTRIDPCEILLPEPLLAEPDPGASLRQLQASMTPIPSARFDSANGELRLKSHFAVAALEGYGAFSRAELGVAGALLDYILLTQLGKLPALAPPRRMAALQTLAIDAATRRNLELNRTLSGERQASLLSTIDRTKTAAGSRLLAQRLANPLTDVTSINARLDAISFFVSETPLRSEIRAKLTSVPEMSRSLGRLSLERGGPRDLANIARGLAIAEEVYHLLGRPQGLLDPPPEISEAAGSLSLPELRDLRSDIAQALMDDLPASPRDGGFVKSGYRLDLDQVQRLKDDARNVIAELQATFVEKTGIKSLKIRHNNFLGYFIDLNRQNAETLQKHPAMSEFVHRQTTVGGMRFTTAELVSLEQRISSAAETALAIELEVFATLNRKLKQVGELVAGAARGLAVIDAAAALAELAVESSYVRPLIDGSNRLFIKSGRHPVVECMLRQDQGAFVPNDSHLGDSETPRILLLTGPNMAGKSTYLRQNALIIILAQMGSFVPAAEVHIGIVDRIFSRVGAADDLARGRSTFMVEMVETATILNQATSRSFVILDEIGRGTATLDGLSIAWATLEHLHEVIGCRAIFATHFHELTVLASRLAKLGNACMKVSEWRGDIVFLHEVVPGAADRSYGIHVARRAGLPPQVLTRAEEVLGLLEKSELSATRLELIDDLPLFSARPRQFENPAPPRSFERRLMEINPDELSPRQALEFLYELQSLMNPT
jgi:DNA mismatch repair protein MutS